MAVKTKRKHRNKGPDMLSDKDKANILSRETVMDWDPEYVFSTGKRMVISADSYEKWMEKMVPQVLDIGTVSPRAGRSEVEKAGDSKVVWLDDKKLLFVKKRMPMWEVINRYGGMGLMCPGALLPRSMVEVRSELKVVQGKKYAAAAFDRPTYIPVLTRFSDMLNVMMSLTPMEVFTCRPGLRKARGHVLLAGLGLGYMARRILERKQVKSVTVVDINKPILDYFGADIAKHPKLRERICADIRTWLDGNRIGQFDSIIVDIWDEYHSAHGERWFKVIKQQAAAKGVNAWGWGDVGY